MIKSGTILRVVDNSGAKWGKCIQVRNKGKYPIGSIGSILLVSLKKIVSRKKVTKRTIYMGLVVGVSHWIVRIDGTFVKFFSNRLLVFNKQNKFLVLVIFILKFLKNMGKIWKK